MKKIISIILTFIFIASCLPVAYAAGAYDEDGKYIYRTSTYDFEIIQDDPQHMTDEVFFGKWDEDTQAWKIEPLLKYGDEDFPGLAPIEEAVKEGDYYAAKIALMEYYLPQKYNKVSKVMSVNDESFFEIKFRERNMYAASTNGQPLDVTDWVTQDWKTITANSSILSSYVTSMATQSPNITLVVASMDKSNTAAQIKSRDTDSPPVLNITVNNVQRQYTAVEDSYISPADNANTNYGNEEILYAQEYGYVGHWSDKSNRWTSEANPTRRTYFKFDVSDIKSTDDVSSASLTFTARTEAGGDLTEKELFIYGWDDSAWEENTIKWNSFDDWKFFSCNEQETWSFLTSENTTEKGKICYFHRGAKLQTLSRVFNNTKDERYAYTFLRELMSTITNVSNRADVMNHLDMSNHVYNVGGCFIACWDSMYMTPEIFTAALKHFYLVTDLACETWLVPKDCTANGATNLARMTYSFSMWYPEFKKSDYWCDITKYSYKWIVEDGALADGSCIEQAAGYVETFCGNISTSHTGIYTKIKNPYYGMYADRETGEIVRNMLINALYSTAWEYEEFGLGDSSNFNSKSFLTNWYGMLLDFGIDDPYLEYVATNGTSGTAPEFTSNSFPAALRTYMRTGWTKNDVMLAFTNKGGEVTHSHRDQLHLVLKAYGQNLLVDSYGAEYAGDRRRSDVSAAMHNTITVNNGNIQNQTAGNDGVEKEQEINDLYNHTTYTTAYVDYASNTERTVLFLKNQKFFIVTDYIQVKDKTKDNKVAQAWHMSPEAYISLSENNEFVSNFESGANIIVSPVDSASMSDIYFTDVEQGVAAGVYVVTPKGVYERTTRDTAKYGTILYPLNIGEKRSIATEEIDVGIENNGASAFRLTINTPGKDDAQNYYYYHLSDLSQKKEIVLGDYITDATSLLVQEDKNGKAVSFFIYDGSYIKKYGIKDEYLFKSNAGDVTFGVDMASGEISEFSSDDFGENTLKDLTVYAGYDVKSITFNSKNINTKKDGAYLYFGDEPIVKCTEDFTPDSDNQTSDEIFGDFTGGRPSSGGGSGGSGGSGGGSISGGGSANTENTDKPDETPVEDTENKEDVNTDNEPMEDVSYSDVSESDWYFNDVKLLSEKAIVSGDGTGNFMPNNNITREQFLKMLMLACEIDTTESENTFGDVIDDAWYKPYVLKAKNIGIVNGISETEFGIGSNITRQDMAVMIARTIEKLGIETNAIESDKFVDENKVADYAKESVEFMKSIGLIEGYNNEFRPLDNLTRAETATIIAKIIRKFDF